MAMNANGVVECIDVFMDRIHFELFVDFFIQRLPERIFIAPYHGKPLFALA